MSPYQIPQIRKDRALFIVVTNDGAKINNNTFQLVVGFKVVDASAIDLMTEKTNKTTISKIVLAKRNCYGKKINNFNHIFQW